MLIYLSHQDLKKKDRRAPASTPSPSNSTTSCHLKRLGLCFIALQKDTDVGHKLSLSTVMCNWVPWSMTLKECAKRMDSKRASGGSTFISWSEELPGPCDVCATLLAAVWWLLQKVFGHRLFPQASTKHCIPHHVWATSSCNTVWLWSGKFLQYSMTVIWKDVLQLLNTLLWRQTPDQKELQITYYFMFHSQTKVLERKVEKLLG